MLSPLTELGLSFIKARCMISSPMSQTNHQAAAPPNDFFFFGKHVNARAFYYRNDNDRDSGGDLVA